VRDHSYYFEEIVLGNSLPALTYSLVKNVPIVFSKDTPPHPFEFFDPHLDLSIYNTQNLVTEVISPTGVEEEGANKLEVWNKVIFKMGLRGLVLFPFKKDSLRIEKENTLRIVEGSSLINICFDQLVVFDGQGVEGLQVEFDGLHQVIDWINISSGAKQKKDLDVIRTGNNFVNEIRFYSSPRTGNSTYKDCAAISYLTSDELMEVDYTDTFAKFEVRRLMKNVGLKGTANGFYEKYPNKERHYDIRLDPTKREINKRTKNCYSIEQNQSIIFDRRSEEEILGG